MLSPSQSLAIISRLHQCVCNKIVLLKWCMSLPFLRFFLAKPALTAVCAVVGVAVLALLIVIIACSMH